MAVDLEWAWDWLLECAEGFDESCADRSKTWPPPIMTPLARAAATSGLRRFYPWLSHNLLRFSIPCDDWIMRPNVAPAFAGVEPNPDAYVVWEGELFSGSTEVTLETPDPVHAVTELERLLAAWPYNQRQGPAGSAGTLSR